MKILVIQKKFMGDVLVTSSLFPLLRQKYPNSELHFFLDKKFSDIVLNHPDIDRLIFFEKDLVGNIHKIKREKYDVVVDVYSKIGTALISFFSGAGITSGYYKPYLSLFYSAPVKRHLKPESQMALCLENRVQLLEALDIPLADVHPKIYLTKTEIEEAENLFRKYGLCKDKKTLMVSTFGSTPEKSYPYMKDIIDRVSKNTDCQIICNYIPSQKDLFQNLYISLSEASKKAIIKDFATENLRSFAASVSLCDALLGNEGGATNVSKALHIPTFGIFSPVVDSSSWKWAEDGVRYDSADVHDYIKGNPTYEDFRPEYFEDQLDRFIQKHLL
ncbi:glycosyltransferase family 9 protein [Daejeonia sp. YH14]|uniref:glycosyltransferase family 9 protein n=1 Tax=Daejeonia sp. YH14 TaxID=3439042 RepID=UPI003F4959C6